MPGASRIPNRRRQRVPPLPVPPPQLPDLDLRRLLRRRPPLLRMPELRMPLGLRDWPAKAYRAGVPYPQAPARGVAKGEEPGVLNAELLPEDDMVRGVKAWSVRNRRLR